METPILLMKRGFGNLLVFIKAATPGYFDSFHSPESVGTSVKQELFNRNVYGAM